MNINEFRKKYPEYNDIPDLELADTFYEKYYSDLDKDNFYKSFFPSIADARIEQAESSIMPESGGIVSPDDELLNQNIRQNINFRPKIKDIAKLADVGVKEGADSEARLAASFGYDEKNQALAIKDVLSKIYNQDIDVRKGARTGELEYFNPKTEKYELVNKPGVDLGDFTGLAGDAMVIIPDIAATVAGTVFLGGLPSGIASGAVTAGIMEYTRYKLGQNIYGINKDISNDQLLDAAFRAAGISAGASVLGVGAVKVIKGVNNLVRGRFVKGNEVADARIEKEVLKADEVAESINKTLDSAKINSNLKFTLGQAGNDADLLAAQAAFENQNKLGFMGEFKEFNLNQAKALNDYFGFLKSGFGSSTSKPINAFEGGTLIQGVIKKNNEPIIKALNKQQAEADEVLTKSILRLPDGSLKETGVEVRSKIAQVAEAYNTKVKAAAKSLDEAAGVNTINSDIVSKAINKLSTKQKNNLIKTGNLQNYFKNTELINDIVAGTAKIPITTVRNTLSTLSSDIRKSAVGSVTGETPEVGALKLLKKSLTEQLNKDAPKAYIDEFNNFNALVRDNKQLLNNELLAKINLDRAGNLRFDDENVFKMSFKTGNKSKAYAEAIHNVIKDSPDAMKAYKDSIFQKYKEDVITNDKVNVIRHNNFFKKFKSPLETFFSKNELNEITKIGGFQTALENATKKRDIVLRDLEKSFAGKLEATTPGEVINKIYRPNNIGEIRELKKILKKDPEIYQAFQRLVLTDLNEAVVKTSDDLGIKVVDAKRFDTYLNGAGNERGYRVALEEVFNKEFVNNLDTLNKALKISSRKAAARGEGIVGSALTDIIRARLGQFTVAGRLFTAARRIYKRTAERIIKNAILDPQSLKDLIRLRKLKSGTKEAAAILSKLGGDIFADPPSDPDSIKPFTILKQIISGE
tara:strand:+ start:2647 stop:5409 length:2763 start_codon:yes stop_codon:yes gene_type:complete